MNNHYNFTEEQKRILFEKQKEIDALKGKLEKQRAEMRKENEQRYMQTPFAIDISRMRTKQAAGILDQPATLNRNEIIWKYVHPRVCELARPRFESGQYADAVESVFKEINVMVKRKVEGHVSKSLDGVQLMQKVFSLERPILQVESDIVSQSGVDTQRGYMFMFAGAISAIRNPKAHENMTISEEDAIRKFHFASMLMYKLDNSILVSQGGQS